jgi:hypothetical protein
VLQKDGGRAPPGPPYNYEWFLKYATGARLPKPAFQWFIC